MANVNSKLKRKRRLCRAGIQTAMVIIDRFLRIGNYATGIGPRCPVCMTAVIGYLDADVLPNRQADDNNLDDVDQQLV